MSEGPSEAPPDDDLNPEPAAETPADGGEDAEPGSRDRKEKEDEADDTAALSAEALAGESRLRRQMRQAGMESLGSPWFDGPASIGGHAAARDVNVYYGPAEPPMPETGRIDPELLGRIRMVHVAGAGHAAAALTLGKQRLVVLRGARGTGKRSTALFMLSKLVGDNVHAVSADQVLGTPTPSLSWLAEHAGHLAESPAPAELAYTRLAALSADLGRRGAYLVITTSAETTADADVEDRFVVDQEPPGGQEVVRSHLRLDAGHADAAERLLRDIPAAPLGCARTPAAAAKLATLLLDTARNRLPADHLYPALAGMYRDRARYLLQIIRPKQPRERVELLCRRAALISIAVFAGLPHADVMAAAESLVTRFIAIEFPGTIEGREIFISWRERLCKEPDLIIEEPEMPGPWGTVRAQRVRFTDTDLGAAVLDVVWEEYETARSPLLEWLHELGVSSPDEAVRVRAAQVAGRLASRDFGHVYHRLLLSWANSVNDKSHEAAATALETLSVTMASHVWQLLAEWCDRGNQHLQRTAVLALGTRISEGHPGDVLDRLGRLALRNTGRAAQTMSEAVRHSVTELFSGSHPEAVVGALRKWAKHPDSRLRALACRCVTPLMYVTGDFEEPVLLRTMVGDPATRANAAAAIAAVLAETDTRQEMWTALEKLVVAVISRHPELTSTLGALLADLTRLSTTARLQIRFYLLLWAHRHRELHGHKDDRGVRS